MIRLIYRAFRVWLLQPAFQGMGPYAFFFVESFIATCFFEWLSHRWYITHRETLGSERARWIAAWIFVLSFLCVIATLTFALNVQ